MIQVEKVKNRIHLTWTDADGDFRANVELAKSVPGYSFVKQPAPHWTYGLSMRNCRNLREAFGAALVIGPELNAWAHKAKKHDVEMKVLVKATDADLENVPSRAPILAEAMGNRTYQRVGARFISTGRCVLIADQPGLGKTLEIMAGIIEAGISGQVLIVAMKTAAELVWEPEINRWLPADLATATLVIDVPKEKRETMIADYFDMVAEKDGRVHFLVVNPEMIRSKYHSEGTDKKKVVWYTHDYPDLFAEPWEAIAIDETAHQQSSLIYNSADMSKASQFRAGAQILPLVENGIKVATSGTPMRGKPRNLWGTLHWLRPDIYTSFWNWARTYFNVYQESVSRDKTVYVVGDLIHEDKLYADLSEIMLRRTKAEVAADLPPKQYGGSRLDPRDPSSPVGVWVEMESAQKKAYVSMAKDAAAELEGGTLMANGILAELTRLKQLAGAHGKMVDGKFVPIFPSNKFNAVLSMLAERGITGNKEESEGTSQVVIASQFTSLINLFAEGFRAKGIECHVLTGETKGKRRKEMAQEFQAGSGPRVFLLNTTAGGVAITLDAADDLFILDETWIPDDQEQVEDRTHRVSRIHQVTIYYIRSLGTLEESIARNNLTADDLQKMLMDGKRGVNTRRVLLGEDLELAA